MKNKIKLFDRGTFVEAINRFKIPGIITGAIFLAAGLLQLLDAILHLAQYTHEYNMPEQFFYITYIVPFIMVPMMMMAAFSYLRVRKTSDFYHALPVKRECLYFSTIAAAFAWIVAELVIASIIPLMMALVSPDIEIEMSKYWEIIYKPLVMSILVLSGFSLGVSLTGNGFTNFFVSIIILIVPRTISTIIYSLAESFTPFLVLNVSNSLLNNQYNVIFREFDFNGDTIPMIATVIYTLILSAIYFAAGAIAFVKRKSEMAGRPSAFRGVQVAARMILPFITLLGALTFLMMWGRYFPEEIGYLLFVASMIISAFTVYFIYELATIRKIKKVLKSLVWFPVLVGGVVVVGIIILIGSNIALNKRADADKIKYVMVENPNSWPRDREFFKIKDEKVFEIVSDAYNRQMDKLDDSEDFAHYYYYEYESDNNLVIGFNQGGTTFYRNVDFDNEEFIELCRVCDKEVLSENKTLELPDYGEVDVYFESYTFAHGATGDIYSALVEELKELTLEELYDYTEEEFLTYAYVHLYDSRSASLDRVLTIPISSATPKTQKAFIKALVDDRDDFYNLKPYGNFLFRYESGDHLEIYLNQMYIIRDEETIETLESVDYEGSGALTDELVQMFKNLEESKDGENAIVIVGILCLNDDPSAYYVGDTFDIEITYKVSDEMLEEFLEYLDKMN